MILKGSRVKVFDYRLFVDDVKTPLSHTVQPATVLQRYGRISEVLKIKYDDLIDVVFEHDGRTSKGHFTKHVEEV